jgi:uncharacterized membrane protein YedE/YeeE
MKDFIFQKQFNWLSSGIALAAICILAVALVKPIGVSTQFVILDGIIYNSVSNDLIVKDENAKKGYTSKNAYLNKSGGKYAKNVENPLNYSFIFVIAMLVGGFIASKMQTTSKKDNNKEHTCTVIPKVWSDKFGHCHNKRYLSVFVGGILVLFGARLAGGCTSGHMMSGMMQTSLSGYLFALATFAVAIPVAMLVFRKDSK